MHRYVTLDVERETPLNVLAAIREVHPTAELVWVGHAWWMGYVKHTPAMEIGYAPSQLGTRYAYTLQKQGFRWLGEYADPFCSAGFLRQEIEFMFGRTDEELARDMLETEQRADGTALEEAKVALVRQAIAQEGRSAYAHVFRKRRSVLCPGISPAQSTPLTGVV